jgi:hypothetical protein
MKRCPGCKEELPTDAFHKNRSQSDGLCSRCKECSKVDYRKGGKYFETRKRYRKGRQGWVTAYSKSYYQKNKKKLYARQKKYVQDRCKRDPCFKLARNLRSRLSTAIKQGIKAGSAVKDLGCSIEEFKQYFESKFQPGMTWENHGKWHIDHIKPLVGFDLTKRSQVLEACHYTNLQPLWAEDNLSKGGRDCA